MIHSLAVKVLTVSTYKTWPGCQEGSPSEKQVLQVFLRECKTHRKSASGGMAFRPISETQVLSEIVWFWVEEKDSTRPTISQGSLVQPCSPYKSINATLHHSVINVIAIPISYDHHMMERTNIPRRPRFAGLSSFTSFHVGGDSLPPLILGYFQKDILAKILKLHNSTF